MGKETTVTVEHKIQAVGQRRGQVVRNGQGWVKCLEVQEVKELC